MQETEKQLKKSTRDMGNEMFKKTIDHQNSRSPLSEAEVNKDEFIESLNRLINKFGIQTFSTCPTLEWPTFCTLSVKVTPTPYPQFNKNMRAVANSHLHYWIKIEMKLYPLLPLYFADTMITNAMKYRYLALSSNLSSIMI